MDVELQAGLPSDDDEILAVGRAFESGTLMAAKVKLAHYGRLNQINSSLTRQTPRNVSASGNLSAAMKVAQWLYLEGQFLEKTTGLLG